MREHLIENSMVKNASDLYKVAGLLPGPYEFVSKGVANAYRNMDSWAHTLPKSTRLNESAERVQTSLGKAQRKREKSVILSKHIGMSSYK